ncbi:MAG: nitroreductase family protein [bacterium]
MLGTQPITKVIRERSSIRKYAARELPGEVFSRVDEILASENVGPFGNRSRFWLVDTESYREDPVRLGTYGWISGARYFIAGAIVKESQMNLEDFGFVMEKKILQFARMGLGTCWIGGTFRRSEYAKTGSLLPGEVIPCITPIGYPAVKKGARERVIKFFARAKTRKRWDQLFFDYSPDASLSPESAGRFAEPLEMVRLAPSANNAQPWRIFRDGDRFHFYLSRKTVVTEAVKAVDLQRIDMGIAMSHFELASKELEIQGNWRVSTPPEKFVKAGEYICTFYPSMV